MKHDFYSLAAPAMTSAELAATLDSTNLRLDAPTADIVALRAILRGQAE